MDTIAGAATQMSARHQCHDLCCFQDPFFLEKTIICCDQDWEQEYFEIHEFGSKDSYIFKVGILYVSLISDLNPRMFHYSVQKQIMLTLNNHSRMIESFSSF